MREKSREIIQLLKDYRNDLPPSDSGMPWSRESERRMDLNDLVGQAYHALDNALSRLYREHPETIEAIYEAYLRVEVGHNEVEWWRTRHTAYFSRLLSLHDFAIEKLTAYLANTELYVRWPSFATQITTKEDANREIIAVFKRYFDRGLSFDDAVANTMLQFDFDDAHYIKQLVRHHAN